MSDLKEFKAWFKGFQENVKKPTEAQWKRVCEEIDNLQDAPTAPVASIATPGKLKAVPGDPATDPRFTPETMPGLNKGQAMSAGPR